MYVIKAKQGEIKKDFSIQNLIDEANNKADNRIENDRIIRGNTKELAFSYLNSLNAELDKINCYERFKISGVDEFSDLFSLTFGHGNASVKINFVIPKIDGALSANIECFFIPFHSWAFRVNKQDFKFKRYELKSVGQVINKMHLIIKYFLISESVPDFTERNRLHELLAKEVK